MSIKNARTLGIRLDQTDNSRLEKFERETTLDGVSLARAALKAALQFYEETGSISLPLYISDKNSKPQPQAAKSGPVKTAASPSNITPLPEQHIAADVAGNDDNLQARQKIVYSSGQKKKKG